MMSDPYGSHPDLPAMRERPPGLAAMPEGYLGRWSWGALDDCTQIDGSIVAVKPNEIQFPDDYQLRGRTPTFLAASAGDAVWIGEEQEWGTEVDLEMTSDGRNQIEVVVLKLAEGGSKILISHPSSVHGEIPNFEGIRCP
ncbi:hypothetical protein [Pontixanthobacter aquaemixtae]|uniref:hypothetical protein n=1 Tax=Pontixanthobacter aquaemixtae TaxID=1958940 RepID=UPI00136B1F32|nr:hypothetical protein [Pontixanthobacter aquaemixtae]